MSKPTYHTNDSITTKTNGGSASPDMELRRRLLQSMAETLSPRQYQVFVLGFLEGMTQQEIADELNLSAASVSRAALAAKYKMRKVLGYEIEDEDYLERDLKIFPEQPYPIKLPGIRDISA